MASDEIHLLTSDKDDDDEGAGRSNHALSQDGRTPPGNDRQGNTVSPPQGPEETKPLQSIPPIPLEMLKTKVNAYIMWFPFGILGFHHFYLNDRSMGFNYLFTFGLFGFGWLVDFWRIPMLVKDANTEIEARWMWEHETPEATTPDETPEFNYEKPKRLSDCYILGFTTGIFGFHQKYLNRQGMWLLYTFTGGLFGVGVLVDWVRMPILFKRYKEKRAREKEGLKETKRYYLDDAYVLAVPGGLLGFHNFYLGRHFWGFVYLFTLGGLGVGWFIDLIRLPLLVEDANLRSKSLLSPVDDIEEGVRYQSSGETPRIDPYYSDYNSNMSSISHHSLSQSETFVPAPPAGAPPAVRPRAKRRVPKPQHFKEFKPADGDEVQTPTPPPELPPPYSPEASTGSAPTNETTA